MGNFVGSRSNEMIISNCYSRVPSMDVHVYCDERHLTGVQAGISFSSSVGVTFAGKFDTRRIDIRTERIKFGEQKKIEHQTGNPFGVVLRNVNINEAVGAGQTVTDTLVTFRRNVIITDDGNLVLAKENETFIDNMDQNHDPDEYEPHSGVGSNMHSDDMNVPRKGESATVYEKETAVAEMAKRTNIPEEIAAWLLFKSNLESELSELQMAYFEDTIRATKQRLLETQQILPAGTEATLSVGVLLDKLMAEPINMDPGEAAELKVLCEARGLNFISTDYLRIDH